MAASLNRSRALAILYRTGKMLDLRKTTAHTLRTLRPTQRREREGSVDPCRAGESFAQDQLTRSYAASIVAKVARGAGALSLGAIINTVGQLAIIPIAMWFWGPARWGEWTALAGVVSVFAMADLGIQYFVSNQLCAAHARDQTSEFCATLHSALIVTTPVAVLVFLCFTVAVSLAPVPSWLAVKTIGGLELRALLMLLALRPLLGAPMGIVASVYRATGRLARGEMVGNARYVASSALLIAMVGMRAGFLSVAAGQLLIDCGVTAWIIRDLRSFCPWLVLWPRLGGLRDGLRMIVPGLFFLLIPVANSIGNDLILVIVQRVCGGRVVSQFITHRTAVNCARTLGSALTIAAWPQLTMIHARGDRHELAAAHRSLAKASFWTVGFAAASVAGFFPTVYPIWTSGRLRPDYLTLGLLAARIVVWGLSNASVVTLLALNRQREVAVATFWTAALAAVLALMLVPRAGIEGAALALLIGELCGTAWVAPVLACRETNENMASFLTYVLGGPVMSFMVGSIFVAGAWVLLPRTSVKCLLAIPLGAIGAIIVMWACLPSAERYVVKSMVLAIWPTFNLGHESGLSQSGETSIRHGNKV